MKRGIVKYAKHDASTLPTNVSIDKLTFPSPIQAMISAINVKIIDIIIVRKAKEFDSFFGLSDTMLKKIINSITSANTSSEIFINGNVFTSVYAILNFFIT